MGFLKEIFISKKPPVPAERPIPAHPARTPNELTSIMRGGNVVTESDAHAKIIEDLIGKPVVVVGRHSARNIELGLEVGSTAAVLKELSDPEEAGGHEYNYKRISSRSSGFGFEGESVAVVGKLPPPRPVEPSPDQRGGRRISGNRGGQRRRGLW